MYAGILHMLGDGVFHDLAVAGHGVKLDLLGVFKEFGDHDRIFLRHLRRLAEELMHLLVVVADVHRCAGKHIAGTYEDREPYFLHEFVDLVFSGQLLPAGLVDAELVEHGGELVAVLGAVDRDGGGAEHGDVAAVELHREVVGDLSAHADDDAVGSLKVDDVHHALEAELVEVEAVAHIVVGRHCLRVVVDHDCLVAELAAGGGGVDRTPVKLHRAADAVGS